VNSKDVTKILKIKGTRSNILYILLIKKTVLINHYSEDYLHALPINVQCKYKYLVILPFSMFLLFLSFIVK